MYMHARILEKMATSTIDQDMTLMETDQTSEDKSGAHASMSTSSIKLDVFQPLTSATTELQQCRDQPDLPHKATQSVLVDDALYISDPDKAVLYKYSISKKSWYTLPTEGSVSQYTLAMYHSKVVLIGGLNQDRSYSDKYIRVLGDADLEEKMNSSIIRFSPPFQNTHAATSDGNNLFIVCSDGLWVYNGNKWVHSPMKESPKDMEREMSGNVCHILINDGFIYMSIDSTSKLYRAALGAEDSAKSPTDLVWEVIITEDHKLPKMTRVGDQIVKVAMNGTKLKMSAYSMLNQKWVEIEDLKLAFRSIVSAIGVPVNEQQPKQLDLWVVGWTTDRLGAEKVVVLKVIIKMEQYQPCGLVTLRQLYKLEMGTQHIDVLTQLVPHIESFKDMAGFMLNERKAGYHYDYGCQHPIAGYICSWQFEENPMREPTWKNFLYILGELGLKSLATTVESFLLNSNHLAVTEETEMQTNPPKTTTLIGDLKLGLSNLRDQLTDEQCEKVSAFTEQCETILQAVAKEKQEYQDRKEELEKTITEQSNKLQSCIIRLRQLVKEPSAKRPRTEPEVEELKPELKDIFKELYTKAADKWENLGIFLGVNPGQLDAIKTSTNNQSSQNCLREMLKTWLKQIGPAPTWKAMVNAIKDLDDLQLVSELEKKYCVMNFN